MVSAVFASSIFANNIAFNSADTNWHSSNVKEALDYLRGDNNRVGILVKRITTKGESYTMRKNGYITGTMSPECNHAGAMIYFNTTDENAFDHVVSLAQFNFCYTFPVSIYVPAGTVVYTRPHGTYDLRVYEW